MLNLNRSKAVFISAILSVAITACGSPEGYNSKSTVDAAPPPAASNAPVVMLSALSSAVAYGGSTTVSWTSSNATSCTSSGGGGAGTEGSFGTGALTTTTTYVVTCTGTGGSASQGMTITVAPSSITGFVNTPGGGNITVTSPNDLTSGMIITISGTTSYNGTYTVVSATSTNFVIAHVWVNASETETGTWQLAGGMLAGCSTSGDTGAITLSNLPSRFNGVAPLSVFFDASATTATSTTRPYHDLDYRWDFGDAAGSPVSGTTWGYGSRAGVNSRNAATGPGAGHVFETPNTYTVTLTVTDGTNTVTNNCARIVVQDPEAVFAGSNTICFSTSGTFTACPAGATQITTSNFASAINTYKAANRRLLFRRGETFTAASSASLTVNGPGIIGAFGSGTSLPIAKIAAGATFPIMQVSSSSTPNIGDWRIMDFDFDGSSVTTSSDVSAIATAGGFNQLLALRLNIHDIYRGIAAGYGILDYWNSHGQTGHTKFKGWSVVDSRITGLPGCNWDGHYNCDWRVYIAGTQVSVMGNFLDNQGLADKTSGGSHTLRSEHMDHSVISNNDILRAGSFQHALKIHSVVWQSVGVADPTGVGVASEKILISDNKIGGGPGGWTVSLGPQDEINNEHVQDIVFERNWITSGTGSQVAIETSVSDSTFRNNIFDMTGAAYHTGMSISRRGIEPIPNNDRIYNNTFYSGSTGDFEGVHVGTATNTTVQNNLGSAPAASGPVMISGTVTTLSNNILNNSPSALFLSATPSTPANFGLKSLPNPARDTGLLTVPVLTDFFGTARPQNGGIDIGAAEGT